VTASVGSSIWWTGYAEQAQTPSHESLQGYDYVQLTVADGGRLATITGAPPAAARGVTIVDIYVQADGGRLASMAERLGNGEIGISVGGIYGLAAAADALNLAVGGGGGGAVVLRV
jgi:hypothetical protein